MSFKDIIGHEDVKSGIENSISAGKLAHAHLFTGDDGLGKSLLAKEMALKILGKSVNRQYVDIIECRAEKGKQSVGINDIISIIEEINKKPYESDKKVVIIYKAHTLTVEAQNAFLKTIEEPPKGVFIFLLCENSEDILDTVKSRCQIHKLKRLSIEEIKEFLGVKFPDLTPEEIRNIASFSDGIPGRAGKLINDNEFNEIRNKLMELLLGIKRKSLPEMLEYEEFFMKYKDKWRDLLICILSYIRDGIVYKETECEDLIINMDKINSIKEFSSMFSFSTLNNMIDIVTDTGDNLKRNVNPALVFDLMLLKIQEAK